MSFSDFILNNYQVLFELFGLLIILIISVHIPDRMKIFMRTTVILLFVAIIAHNLEAWTQTLETYTVLRPLLTSVKYLIYPIILMMLIETISQDAIKIPKKFKILMLIPELICIPLYFSSQWTHIVFYYRLDNVYEKGAIYFLPYIIFAIYLILFIIQIIFYLRHYKTRDKIIALYITLVSAAFIIIYLILKGDTDFTPIFTSATVFYFLFIYIHLASLDPLTGLMNRQSYYKDINDINDRIESVIVVDMNELKYLNDTYGHDAGDTALKIIAKILLKHAGHHKAVYRTGGDEFIILYSIKDEKEIKRRIQAINDDLAKTDYTCALGYAMRKKEEKVVDTVSRADNNMYEDKKRRKQEILAKGGQIHNR